MLMLRDRQMLRCITDSEIKRHADPITVHLRSRFMDDKKSGHSGVAYTLHGLPMAYTRAGAGVGARGLVSSVRSVEPLEVARKVVTEESPEARRTNDRF